MRRTANFRSIYLTAAALGLLTATGLAGCAVESDDEIQGAGSGGGPGAAGSAGASGAPGTAGTPSAAGAAGTPGAAGAAGTAGAAGAPMGGRSGQGGGGGGAAGMSGSGGSAGSTAGGRGGSAGAGTGGSTMVPPGAYCDVTANWNPMYATLEDQILVIVNQRRAEGATCGGMAMPPVGPLTMNANLRCAARAHSKDMADRDFFDHDNPDGDGPDARIEDAGYDGRGWGENIAAGNETAEETMMQWMESSGHCRNIMSANFTEIGVGYYPGGQYRHIWTQTFGRR